MPTSPIAQAIIALTLAVCALAVWKGGPGERLAGLVVGAGVVATLLASLLLPVGVISIFYLTGDGLIAVILLLATLRYGTPWLGGVMLLYAAQFALHGFYFVMERKPDRFHAIFNNLNLLAMLTLLVTGTVLAWRRRARVAAQALA